MTDKEDKWKKRLSEEEYKILREKGTEKPFTGPLLHNEDDGTYSCAACGNPVFDSDTKFDSGTGWPSFFDAIKVSVKLNEDISLGMKRIEVACNKCSSHLGHLFDDGPQPTGKRFCINSMSLKFKKK